MSPANFDSWEKEHAKPKMRRSPQWGSFNQRCNYYKLYCFWFAEKYLGGVTLNVLFQAVYGPHVALLVDCGRRNPFLSTLPKDNNLCGEYHVPIVLGPAHGVPDET